MGRGAIGPTKLISMIAKFKELVKLYEREIFLGFCLLLVLGIGYNIGHIYANYRQSGTDGSTAAIISGTKASATPKKPAITATPKDSRVVASKAASSKLYHYTWCSGAQRIKETNKLWFASAAAAEAAGYTLAANCTP